MSESRKDFGKVRDDEGYECKKGVPRMIPSRKPDCDGGASAEVAAAASRLYPRGGGRAGGDQATQKR